MELKRRKLMLRDQTVDIDHGADHARSGQHRIITFTGKSKVQPSQRIKDVDECIWLVSFMQYDLDCIDLERKTLQT